MFNPETITKITRYLQNAEEGQFVEDNGRKVVVTNMDGGRYLFYNGDYIMGQADQVFYAIKFLRTGEYTNEKYAGDAAIR